MRTLTHENLYWPPGVLCQRKPPHCTQSISVHVFAACSVCLLLGHLAQSAKRPRSSAIFVKVPSFLVGLLDFALFAAAGGFSHSCSRLIARKALAAQEPPIAWLSSTREELPPSPKSEVAVEDIEDPRKFNFPF